MIETTTSVAQPRSAPIPQRRALEVVLGGHLSWIAWSWLAIFVILGATMFVLSRIGEPDASVWRTIAGFQLWIGLAAGASTIPSFVRLFVANGATRHALARASIIAAVVLSALGGVLTFIGFAIEGVVFDVSDWRHVFGELDDDLGYGFMALAAIEYAVMYACYFATGWMAGIAWNQLGWFRFVLALVPAFVPVIAAELLLSTNGPSGLGWFDAVGDLPSVVPAVFVAAIAAVANVIASRATRSVTVAP